MLLIFAILACFIHISRGIDKEFLTESSKQQLLISQIYQSLRSQDYVIYNVELDEDDSNFIKVELLPIFRKSFMYSPIMEHNLKNQFFLIAHHDTPIKCVFEILDSKSLKLELKTFDRFFDGLKPHPNLHWLGYTQREIEKIGTKVEFEQFKRQFSKRYANDAAENERYNIFKNNLRKARLLQLLEHGTAIYGINKFSDLSEQEFEKFLSGKWNVDLAREQAKVIVSAETFKKPLSSRPDEFDWRNLGAVTPVKNQGFCGSCWAFSVTGNIEGQWFKKSNDLVSLSEQELVDCDKYDEGCNGGLPTQAYKSILELGGLESETDYPYIGHESKTCSLSKTKIKAYINSSVVLDKDESLMADWLTDNSPISIGINANVMQFYMGGISYPSSWLCNKNSLDHGVLIVGYGVGETKFLRRKLPFWIIKNSWGEIWGEKGYYRVYRGKSVCGVDQLATSALVL